MKRRARDRRGPDRVNDAQVDAYFQARRRTDNALETAGVLLGLALWVGVVLATMASL